MNMHDQGRTRTSPGKIRRIKLSDQISEELRSWIVRDRMAPGDRLPNEKSLMAHFGCSKGTIREALKALEVGGLVAVHAGANGGAEILPASPESAEIQLRQFLHFQKIDFRQVYELRKSVEVMLAHNITGKITADQFARLRENIEECVVANASDNKPVARSVETVFHDILCEACDNPILVFMCRFLNSLLRDLVLFRAGSLSEHREFGDHNVGCHVELLKAFEAGDAETAAAIMKHHMESAEQFMLRLDASFQTDLLSRQYYRP